MAIWEGEAGPPLLAEVFITTLRSGDNVSVVPIKCFDSLRSLPGAEDSKQITKRVHRQLLSLLL